MNTNSFFTTISPSSFDIELDNVVIRAYNRKMVARPKNTSKNYILHQNEFIKWARSQPFEGIQETVTGPKLALFLE
jgi:hypothetical protein